MTAAFVLLSILGCYFLPTIVANIRGHHNGLSVFVLNLLLGWTLIGWVVALVWACTRSKPQTIIIQRAGPAAAAGIEPTL